MGPAARSSATTRVLAWGLIALTVSGCSSWQAMRVAAPAHGERPTRWGELHVRKSDGEKVTLHAWTLQGDTLRGTAENWTPSGTLNQDEALALSDVALQRGSLQGDTLRKVLESTPALPVNIRVRLTNGTTISVKHARVDGDSLRGLVVAAGGDHRASRPVAIALKDVWAIEKRQFNIPKTLALTAGLFAAAYGALIVIYVAGGFGSD